MYGSAEESATDARASKPFSASEAALLLLSWLLLFMQSLSEVFVLMEESAAAVSVEFVAVSIIENPRERRRPNGILVTDVAADATVGVVNDS
jgi:hypothetical protein